MTDRFASLKTNNTFKKSNNKRRHPPQKQTSRFDSLNEKKSNRFSYKPKQNKKFNNRRDNSNNTLPRNIGKFTQVGKGEVEFTPQFKSSKKSQKEIKKERKKEKLKVINKKEEEDWESLQTEDDIALTLAMAQQYQYFTESEEEEEEYEHDPLTPDTDLV
jgi:hypothetical protein